MLTAFRLVIGLVGAVPVLVFWHGDFARACLAAVVAAAVVWAREGNGNDTITAGNVSDGGCSITVGDGTDTIAAGASNYDSYHISVGNGQTPLLEATTAPMRRIVSPRAMATIPSLAAITPSVTDMISPRPAEAIQSAWALAMIPLS